MSIVFASDESVQASGFQAFYGVDCDVQVPLSIALANCGKARRHVMPVAELFRTLIQSVVMRTSYSLAPASVFTKACL